MSSRIYVSYKLTLVRRKQRLDFGRTSTPRFPKVLKVSISVSTSKAAIANYKSGGSIKDDLPLSFVKPT
jgi:hypothetical protein